MLISVLPVLGIGACAQFPPPTASTSSPPQTVLSPRPNSRQGAGTHAVPAAQTKTTPSSPAPPPSANPGSQSPGPSAVLTSADQTTRFILPRGWTSQLKPDDPLDMQITNPSGDTYITVQTTPKEDLPGLSLKDVSKLLLEGSSPAMVNPEVKGPTSVTTVNGHPAVQYTIEGKIGDLDMMMLHTAVETPQYYHQILAAAPRARFDANQANIQQVIQGFQVLPKTTPAS